MAQARENGIELVGPNGLLTTLPKRVLEAAREAEMSEHLGYDKHDPVGPKLKQLPQRGPVEDSANRDWAPVEIDVPVTSTPPSSPRLCGSGSAG